MANKQICFSGISISGSAPLAGELNWNLHLPFVEGDRSKSAMQKSAEVRAWIAAAQRVRESLAFANELLAQHNMAVCDKHPVSWKLDAYDSCPECAAALQQKGQSQ
jgi:hypothetical protein